MAVKGSEMAGVYKKYRVEKADGSPVDPEAQYFVLRLDTDKHARMAALAYAKSCKDENPDLAQDLWNWVSEITIKLRRVHRHHKSD